MFSSHVSHGVSVWRPLPLCERPGLVAKRADGVDEKGSRGVSSTVASSGDSLEALLEGLKA